MVYGYMIDYIFSDLECIRKLLNDPATIAGFIHHKNEKYILIDVQALLITSEIVKESFEIVFSNIVTHENINAILTEEFGFNITKSYDILFGEYERFFFR